MADSKATSTIWRTVVFAGAMLGTPTIAAAEQVAAPPKAPAPTAGAPVASRPAPPPVKPDPAVEKQERIKSLDAERTALLSRLAEAEVKDIDKLKKDIVAKDTAIRRLVDELVNLRKPRPRAQLDAKPVGRGFVLA